MFNNWEPNSNSIADINKEEYINGNKFHNSINQVYSGKYGIAVNKKHELMAKVIYERPHENNDYNDERRGYGNDYATWIFSEENGTAENIFSTGLELMIDTRLEPNASIGLHQHTNTEEIYYILEGNIVITIIDSSGNEYTESLGVGDAHLVRKGQSHYGVAGNKGVRFITVALK